jgi:hypothetical protein
MKYCLCAIALVVQPCFSCDLHDIGALKTEVESAFEVKTFAGYVLRQGVSGPVTLTVEDKYDEDNPRRSIDFKDILELSAWFHEMHESVSSMIIPEKVSCNLSSCSYELPERTLHHGVYLTGFEGEQVAGCLSLVRMTIHDG